MSKSNETDSATVWVEGLIASERERRRLDRLRKSEYEVISCGKHEVEHYLKQGWEVQRESSRAVRMRKPKMFPVRLEDRSWRLFSQMGYPELSGRRGAQILIRRPGADDLRKQIDVFAADEETVAICECKASEKLVRRSLQKDIEELSSLKQPISNAVRKHFGNRKRKIIWLFITDNIIWSQPDRERAKAAKFNVITERELRYCYQIADLLGPSARYQFLAEYLSGQKIPELSGRTVPAIRGKLGGKTFYAFVTTPRDLLKIAFVNHRALNDPAGVPTYQRLVSRSRMRKIGEFVSQGGFFPTNILLNFVKKPRFDIAKRNDLVDVHFGELYLPDTYQSAWIIDGQHRLYGYSRLDRERQKQNLVVIAFEGLPTEEEANLFVTINSEQKTVPRTLLDDLEGELKWGSEVPSERIGSMAARLIHRLNTTPGEPFYNRVTAQGITPTPETCLTIPQVKEGLKRSGLIGRSILGRKEYQRGPLCGADDFETLDRAQETITAYFTAIKESSFQRWQSGRDAHICTNTGIQGHLLLMASVLEHLQARDGLDPFSLDPVDIASHIIAFTDPVLRFISNAIPEELAGKFARLYGSGGANVYHFNLVSIVQQTRTTFSPHGFEDWSQAQQDERKEAADRQLQEINAEAIHFVFDRFKAVWGESKEAYFEKGVENRSVKESCYNKSLEDDLDDRMSKENYLEFLDIKKIVERPNRWPLFDGVFHLPLSDEDKGKAKCTDWMIRVNSLRRIPAHKTTERNYTLSDLEFLESVHERFIRNVREAETNPISEDALRRALGEQ